MRVFSGDAGHIYQIHKMYLEYLADVGASVSSEIKKDLFMWVPRFAETGFFVKLAMHGKLNVGMCWGRVTEKRLSSDEKSTEKRIEVEGIFIRRGFRGRIKAIKKLLDGLNDILCQTSAVAISTIVPENLVKSASRKGFKVSGILVEKRLGA